jgi:hypothetical protein
MFEKRRIRDGGREKRGYYIGTIYEKKADHIIS